MFKFIRIRDEDIKVPAHLFDEMKVELDSIYCIAPLNIGLKFDGIYKKFNINGFTLRMSLVVEEDENIWHTLKFYVNKKRELEMVDYFNNGYNGDVSEKNDFIKPIRRMRLNAFSHEE